MNFKFDIGSKVFAKKHIEYYISGEHPNGVPVAGTVNSIIIREDGVHYGIASTDGCIGLSYMEDQLIAPDDINFVHAVREKVASDIIREQENQLHKVNDRTATLQAVMRNVKNEKSS